jgi:DNA modification methylase
MKLIPNGSIDLIVTDPPYKMTKQGNSCRPNYMKSGMGSKWDAIDEKGRNCIFSFWWKN